MAQPIGIIYIYALLHSVLTQLPAACASIFRLHYIHNAAAKDDVVVIILRRVPAYYIPKPITLLQPICQRKHLCTANTFPYKWFYYFWVFFNRMNGIKFWLQIAGWIRYGILLITQLLEFPINFVSPIRFEMFLSILRRLKSLNNKYNLVKRS